MWGGRKRAVTYYLKHTCGFKSFSATTHVLMADGTTKPIADIREGDLVQAADPETGEAGPRAVTAVRAHDDQLFTLDTADGSIVTTENHPFWNETDQQWQRVDDINPGDALLAADHTTTLTIGIRHGSGRTASAYNLTIEGIHTYYVIAGNTPVLVHNTNGPGACDLTLGAGPNAREELGWLMATSMLQVFAAWSTNPVTCMGATHVAQQRRAHAAAIGFRTTSRQRLWCGPERLKPLIRTAWRVLDHKVEP